MSTNFIIGENLVTIIVRLTYRLDFFILEQFCSRTCFDLVYFILNVGNVELLFLISTLRIHDIKIQKN